MGLNNTINRFTKKTGTDLLTYYGRIESSSNEAGYLNWTDIKAIGDLIITSQENQHLTLLLQTRGGDIHAAKGLLKMLKGKYQNITAIVINVSKSAGAFIALCSQDFYMDPKAVISDFTMNPQDTLTVEQYIKFTKECKSLFLNGFVKSAQAHQGHEAFFNLTNCLETHGEDINFDVINQMLPVKSFHDYGQFSPHLSHIHNHCSDVLENQSGVNKIIGLNTNLTLM